jgi:hypothetical protein
MVNTAASTAAGIQQFTNLTVKDASNGSVIGMVGSINAGTNNINANISIPANTTKVLDVYVDFGSASAGLSISASSSISYTGMISNTSNTATVATGVTTNSGTAQILAGGVTFNSGLSPVYQGVVGGQSGFNVGTFNFKTNNSVGGATLKDVTFTSATGTVASVTMNGKSAQFSNGVATIYDVGTVVPADAGGINVPVTVSLVCVGLTNGCPAVSSSTVQIGIAGLTYNNGTTVNTDLAAGTTTPIAATSTALGLFNSVPKLTVNSTQQTGLNTGTGVENKIGEVTIAADANGQVKVNTITFTLSNSGYTATPLAYSSVRIADGNATVAGSSCTTGGVCTLGTTPSGYSIAAGTSKTFSLYATKSAGASSGNVVISESASVSSAGLSWDDVVGGGTNLTGGMIYNFPTNAYSIRQ